MLQRILRTFRIYLIIAWSVNQHVVVVVTARNHLHGDIDDVELKAASASAVDRHHVVDSALAAVPAPDANRNRLASLSPSAYDATPLRWLQQDEDEDTVSRRSSVAVDGSSNTGAGNAASRNDSVELAPSSSSSALSFTAEGPSSVGRPAKPKQRARIKRKRIRKKKKHSKRFRLGTGSSSSTSAGDHTTTSAEGEPLHIATKYGVTRAYGGNRASAASASDDEDAPKPSITFDISQTAQSRWTDSDESMVRTKPARKTNPKPTKRQQLKRMQQRRNNQPMDAAEGQHSGDNRNSSSIDNDETTPPPPPPNTAGADEAAGAARTWRQRSRSFVASDSVTDVATAAATQLPSNAAAAAVGAAAIEYLHAADVKQSPIIVGDLSCLKDKFRPAPAVANADIKYLRNELLGQSNSYLEAEYICQPGFRLARTNHSTTVFCRNRRWIGHAPRCEPKNTNRATTSTTDSTTSAPVASKRMRPNTSSSLSANVQVSVAASLATPAQKRHCPPAATNALGFAGQGRCHQPLCRPSILSPSKTTTTTTTTAGAQREKRKRCRWCRKGFQFNADDNLCWDIDECNQQAATSPHAANGTLCGPRALCRNTIGSYRCECAKGYQQQQQQRADDFLDDVLDVLDGVGDDDNNDNDNDVEADDSRNQRRQAAAPLPSAIPQEPRLVCADINECLLRNGHGPCQDTCVNLDGGYRCSCDGLPGTVLAGDAHSCDDVDECLDNNGGCSHTCLNTMGRAFCVCPVGWLLDVGDWKTCVDINECTGDGTATSSLCADEGAECVNTLGSYRCVPPPPTDSDVAAAAATGAGDDFNDVVELAPMLADVECPPGFEYSMERERCEDIDECAQQRDQCRQICKNTDGHYRCDCYEGYVLAADSYTCQEVSPPNMTTTLTLTDNAGDNDDGEAAAAVDPANVFCPPLFPPKHGYLECSRPLPEPHADDRAVARDDDTDVAAAGGNAATPAPVGQHGPTSNRPGGQCVLRCPTGYWEAGRFEKICDFNGRWVGEEGGACIKYQSPVLRCPPDIVVELKPHEHQAHVRLATGRTDVNWTRDVRAQPPWAKHSAVQLPVGRVNVTLTAVHPLVPELSVSCAYGISVLDGEPPVVEFCPRNRHHTISAASDPGATVRLSWTEPRFVDNINVTSITKTGSPGSYFAVGSHRIVYTAHDAAGYKAHCIFKMIVRVATAATSTANEADAARNRYYHHQMQLPIDDVY